MAVSIGLVNSRLTILDRFTVTAEQLYRFSAVLDFLPTFRALEGVKAAGAAGVRGISPGYLAIGEQADPNNPLRVVVDEAAHLRPAAGAAGAGLAPLKLTAGPANTAAEDGAIEWTATNVAPTFVYGGTRKTFAFSEAAVSAVTASLPLSSSGGLTPNITVAITPTNNGGAVALQATGGGLATYQVGRIALGSAGQILIGDPDLVAGGYVTLTPAALSMTNVNGVDSCDLTPAVLLFDGTAVVGKQGLAVANATGLGDIVAQFNTLLARLRAGTGHGLIAVA